MTTTRLTPQFEFLCTKCGATDIANDYEWRRDERVTPATVVCYCCGEEYAVANPHRVVFDDDPDPTPSGAAANGTPPRPRLAAAVPVAAAA